MIFLRKLFLFLSVFVVACTSRQIRHDQQRVPASDLRGAESRNGMAALRTAYGRSLQLIPNFEQSSGVPQKEKIAHIFSVLPSASQIQSCIVQTCGPAPTNWGAYDVISRPGFNILEPSQTAKNLWANDLGPRFERIMTQNLEDEAKAIRRARELLDQGIKIEQSHPFKAVLVLMRFTPLLTKYVVPAMKANPFFYLGGIDEAIFQSVYSDLSELEKDALKHLLRGFYFGAIRESLTIHSFENKLVQRLRLRYPGVSLAEAQVRDANTVLSKLDGVSSHLGQEFKPFIIDQTTQQIILRAKAGEELNSLDSDVYFNAVRNLEFLANIYDGGSVYQSLMKIPYDFGEQFRIFKENRYEEMLAQNTEKMNSINATISETQKQCQIKISLSWELNASEFRIRKIPETIFAVKEAAKVILSRWIDPLYHEHVLKSVDQIEYAYPESNNMKLARLISKLQAEEENIELKKRWTAMAGPLTHQLYLLSALSQMQKSKTEIDKEFKENSLITACNELPIETVSDYALTSTGKINVSWFTANYPGVGVSIIAHEVGHVVSSILRRDASLSKIVHEKFLQTRQCVANRNPFVVQPIPTHIDATTRWLEEDWADFFSSMIMNELKNQQSVYYSEVNKGCAIVKDTGVLYTDHSLDPAENDSHSSGALRLLFVGHDRGSLPSACSNLLDDVKAAQRSLDCR
jgi:hypothetical protein